MHLPRKSLLAALVATALIGAGGGAAVFGAVRGEKTVTVTSAVPAPASAASQTSQLSVAQIYQRDAAGVVEITTTSQSTSSPFPFGGGSGTQQAEGSGFVYDTKGDIITNQHVVDGAQSIKVRFSDGSVYSATVVGADATTDLAVIKVNAPASALHPLTLTDSSKLAVGDGVVAIGSPFGLPGTVTSGIVSALGREITSPNNSAIENAIQTDAAINHGNSGGPLLDLQGDVVGITAQIDSNSGGNDGVGFAIPSSTVSSVVGQLLANGKAQHALLGVDVKTIPQQVAAQVGSAAGVAITSVQSGSGAAQAGLKASTGSKGVGGTSYPTGGDVVTALGGTRVTTAEQLRALISARKPGDTVRLTIVRGGKTRTITATLGAKS